METINSKVAFGLVVIFFSLSVLLVKGQPKPGVTSPVNYCLGSPASPLTATGSNLKWSYSVSSDLGGQQTYGENATYAASGTSNNKKTNFKTFVPNVRIKTVDFTLKGYSGGVQNVKLGIFNKSGTLLASSTNTVSANPSVATKFTFTFNYTLAAAGEYSIGLAAGAGNIGFEAPGTIYPLNDSHGVISITGVSETYRLFNNITYDVTVKTNTAPTPVTTAVGKTIYQVTQTINGKESSASTIEVNILGAPAVTSPLTFCQDGSGSLSATGTGLLWSKGVVSSVGGTAIYTNSEHVNSSGNNRKTIFTTYTQNVTIRSVDYSIPANQKADNLQVGLYKKDGTLLATSSVRNIKAGGIAIKVTNEFNYNIAEPGEYYVGVASGSGEIGYGSSSFPISEPTNSVSISEASPSNRYVFNNIQFTTPGSYSSTKPTPSTDIAGTFVYYVTQTVNGCVTPPATIFVNVEGVTSTTGGLACVGQPVTLKATASPGFTLKWYDKDKGGSAITNGVGSGGETLTIPSLSTTKTYYVEASNGSCTSKRVPVQAILGGYTRIVWANTTAWSNPSNWSSCSNDYPNNGANVTIPETVRNIELNEDITLTNLIIEGNTKISLNGYTLTVSALSGTGYLTGGGTSSLILKGTGNSNIRLDQTIPGTTNALNVLEIQGNSRSIVLDNAVVIKGSLNIIGSSTLYSNGNLTLEATATSNANIGSLANGGSVVGNVKVQNYLSGNNSSVFRAFRTVTPPVHDATSPVKGYKVGSYKTYLIITGTGGAANGFDPSPTNGSTIKFYNETKSSKENQYQYPATTADVIPQGKGFYFYYRGNRNNATAKVSSSNGSYPNPENVVMEYYGEINSGNISPALTYTNIAGEASQNGFNLIGNPYPSVIDWYSTGVQKVNIDSKIWVQKANGNFATFDGTVGTADGSRYIFPGQGFFVKATGVNPRVTFTEAAKVTNPGEAKRLLSAGVESGLALNGSGTIKQTSSNVLSKVGITLSKDEYLNDETVVVFSNENKQEYDDRDMIYQGEGAVTLTSITPDNKYLAVNYTQSQQKEIRLFTRVKNSGDYLFKVSQLNLPEDHLLFLNDALTGKAIALDHKTAYHFNVDKGNAVSSAEGRFSIIVQPSNAHPFDLANFKAEKHGSRVELSWNTENEKNNDRFEIEQSSDGELFYSIGTVKGSIDLVNQKEYDFADVSPLSGKNYYRLKQVSSSGIYTYSEVVSVDFSTATAGTIKIYPNPATDVISAQLDGANSQSYQYNIYSINGSGEKVLSGAGTVANVSALNKGVYLLEVVNKENNTRYAAGKFIKD